MQNAESQGTQKKAKWYFSIKLKIMVVMILTVVASIAIILMRVIPTFSDELSRATESNMLDLAIAYGSLMNNTEGKEADIEKEKEIVKNLLKDVSVEGISSSYTYLVSSDGMMLFHPTPDKIGSKVENEVVTQLVKDIQGGAIPEPEVVQYEFKGVIKYASYFVTQQKSILVVSADQEEVLLPIQNLFKEAISIGIGISLIMAIIAFIMADTITRPIRRLTSFIAKIVDFDFRENELAKKLCKRKDEIGVMSHAMESMRLQMHTMIDGIRGSSDSINENSLILKEIAEKVNENSSDNSATTEELAASMEETAATADVINGNVEMIQDSTSDIESLTIEGFKTAKEIMERAANLKKTTEAASKKTKDIYSDIQDKTAIALQQSKSVEKINALANAIQEIASQTSLLSLNASIEAARAGEAGRGFAVVAGEIGSLATQSSETVKSITGIVEEVREAVSNMSTTLESTLHYLSEVVMQDYEQFMQVGIQYNEDAETVQNSMNHIHKEIDNLSKTVHDISTAIQGINSTIGEAAAGVSDIANKTSYTVSLTTDTTVKVGESVNQAKELKHTVERFKL